MVAERGTIQVFLTAVPGVDFGSEPLALTPSGLKLPAKTARASARGDQDFRYPHVQNFLDC